MAAITAANSTLSLYSPCPPGLGGPACLQGSCDSPFTAPLSRALKPDNVTSCDAQRLCDDGFAGLNCNICQGTDSCAARQSALNRGTPGVALGDDRSLLGPTYVRSLTCHHQPNAITTTYMECDVVHPTINSVFPGKMALTSTKNGRVENNFTSSGLGPWEAQTNTTLTSLWLDGKEQFYCQATSCFSSNTTTPVETSANFGTNNWVCSDLKCFCNPAASLCSNPTFALKPLIDGLSGSFELPCDYVDQSDPNARTSCAFRGGVLQQFLGSGGLPLKNCQIGACISQGDLREWRNQQQAERLNDQGIDLSPGVVAGLAVFGTTIVALVFFGILGLLAQRRAEKQPRSPTGAAVGLAWENLEYHIKETENKLVSYQGNRRRGSEETGQELFDLQSQSKHTETGRPSSIIATNFDQPPAAKGDILRGISSCVAPGCLKFIMGASGAGKSTLVDILGGRDMRGTVTGTLFYIEKDDDHLYTTAQKRISFVDQEDFMAIPGYMTVRETLLFAADLSNSENVSKEEKMAIVDDVIHMLGLDAVADRQIGDLRRRGISGGERRRTSLAVAMVSRPKVLIADECTSGLDAYSAHRVMTALRRLASGPETGTTVLVTVHQPSSEIFYMADSVLVLDHGLTLFDGSPANALAFCESVGEPVTLGHNVADKLLSYAFKQYIGEATKPPCIRENYMARGIRRTMFGIGHKRNLASTTAMTQIITLLRRYLTMTKREYSGPMAHVIGAILCGLATGAMYYKVSLSIGGFQNRVGGILFLFILLMTMCLSSLTVFHKLRFLVMRERAIGMYSSGCWVAAHLVYDLVLLRIIPTTIMTCIVYWMIGLHASASRFFQFLIVTLLFTITMSLYNMVLAALFEDVSHGIILAGLYVIFNIGLAGFMINLQKMPVAVRWLKWVAPSKFALEAVSVNEVRGLPIIDQLAGVRVKTDASLVANVVFSFDFGAYYRDLIVLGCGFVVAYSLALFAAVQWRMRERR